MKSLPLTYVSGDKPVQFKSRAAASQWYEQNISKDDKKFIPYYTAISETTGAFQLLLGPTSYGLLYTVCSHHEPSCHLMGQLPR